jgi:ATP-dependent helicase/nuclease subunit B
MPCARHFLGWSDPAPLSVARFLLDGLPDGPADLERSCVVVPTQQAGRRLRAALADAAPAVLSARIVTPAALGAPERPARNAASPLCVAAVWTAVLREIDPAACPALFPAPPPAARTVWAVRTADTLRRLRDTLADAGLTIADVLGRHTDALGEPERWRDLAALEQRYTRTLDALGRSDPVRNRIAAAEHPVFPPGLARLVVAAVPDLSPLARRALERAAERMDVAILVVAPPEEADRFDAWGRPRPDAWADVDPAIPDPARAIRIVGSPADQAEAVLEELAAAAAERPLEAAAVGVPDRAVIPFLQDACGAQGLQSFDPANRAVRETALYTLLQAYARFVTEADHGAFSALLRHPDLLACLEAERGLEPAQLLAELDGFQNAFLPLAFAEVAERLAQPAAAEAYPALAAAAAWCDGLRDACARGAVDTTVRAFLAGVYAARTVAGRDPFEAAARQADDALHALADPDVRRLVGDGPALLTLLLQRLAAASIPSEPPPEPCLALEGWFELPWNAAPCLVVAGMNEGRVPAARPADPFLPDSLRETLGCESDAERLARDMWILRAVIESRRAAGRVRFIVAKTGVSGDVLYPSRLLLRAPAAELPARAARLFAPVRARPVPAAEAVPFRLDPRPPAGVAPIPARLSVTAFRDYLACPFRFYLKHILRMEALDDTKRELDALDFGNCVHDALRDMAHDPRQRDATDPDALGDFLAARAEAWIQARFGSAPPLSVVLGLDAAVQRLRAAARVQAELRQAGWRIERAEARLEGTIDGFPVVGRVDRIDVHPETGRVRVLDYKTSDRPDPPDTAHLGAVRDDTPAAWRTHAGPKARRWRDLQLPLYLDMLPLRTDRPAEAGYFNLPKALTDTRVDLWAPLDAPLRASAARCARDVAARIRARVYWPPAERVDHEQYATLFTAGADGFVPPEFA